MSKSCECCKIYWTHLHRKVKCFVTQMNRNSRHSMVIPESFVNYFAWKLSRTIKLEAPNGNVYDVGIAERRNKTVLRSGWEAFVDANHIVENDLLMFRHRGNACFKVVVFDSSGCEKVVSCARIESNSSEQEPSTHSTDMSSRSSDSKTQSSGHGRSDGCQSGSSGHRRKRAKKDAISCPSEDFSGEESPYEHESSESDDRALPKPPYVLSGQCYVTEEHEEKIAALVQETQPEIPLLVAMMTKPNLKPYPDLVIPMDYALAHFPRKNQTITLQLPGQSKKWHCEFRVRSDGGRCGLYSCDFVHDNQLLDGDLCVFQPMTNGKARAFKVMVHLLRKASIDHLSSGNFPHRGLSSTKVASTVRIMEEPDDGEETVYSGHEEHGIIEKSPNHDDAEKTCDLPYMMPLGARLTEVQEKKVLEKVGAIASELPIYVAVMTKTSVFNSLTFGMQYGAMYLRKGRRILVLKLEGKSQTWHAEMRDKRSALRISVGWTSFASDNHLQEGDICLFQLMKNEGQPKMTVYIIRSSSDSKTQSSGRGRSDRCQSGSSGHRQKRAKKDAISSSSSEDSSGEDSSSEHDSSESDDHALPKPLYVLSGQCYVTEEHHEKIVALVQETQPEMPLLVAMMTQPNLKPYPDLIIPKDYAVAHFPRKDQTITLQLPAESKKWHCEFRVTSDGGRCSLYECDFVRDNHLLEGDLCLFQPMEKAKGRTFKVIVHLL
ncbi:unnamed protein product [Alopecurus aequalis]